MGNQFSYDPFEAADVINTAVALAEDFEVESEDLAAAVRVLIRAAVEANDAAAEAQEAYATLNATAERTFVQMHERNRQLSASLFTYAAASRFSGFQVAKSGVAEHTYS